MIQACIPAPAAKRTKTIRGDVREDCRKETQLQQESDSNNVCRALKAMACPTLPVPASSRSYDLNSGHGDKIYALTSWTQGRGLSVDLLGSSEGNLALGRCSCGCLVLGHTLTIAPFDAAVQRQIRPTCGLLCGPHSPIKALRTAAAT